MCGPPSCWAARLSPWLVHAALIDYPRYVSRHSGWFISPEQAIDELVAWRQGPPAQRSLVQALFRHWGRLRRR